MPNLAPGNGICNVAMINTGWLKLSPLNKWISSDNDVDIPLPVMSFVIEKDGDVYIWDLGLPLDESVINDTVRSGFHEFLKPIIVAPLPSSLSADQQERLKGVFLSHYHWDHSGDATVVPSRVPIFLGRGSLEAIASTDHSPFGFGIGDVRPEIVSRLQEVGGPEIQVEGFEYKGNDVFGDGSLVVVPAPGHCPGHSIAIVKVALSPESYIVLGGDSGHNRGLYVPCPCHHARARFSDVLKIHNDVEMAEKNLLSLSRLQDRDDVWVILAHEHEAIGIVPERTNLGDWRNCGWKQSVQKKMESDRSVWCYAG